MKTLIVLLLLYGTSALAAHPNQSRCASEQEIGYEVVRRELSGGSLPGLPSVCLGQRQFKHVLASNQGADENVETPIVLDGKVPVQVRVYKTPTLAEKFEEESDRRAEYFQVKDGREIRLGTLYFSLYKPGTPMHQRYGCAGLFSPPKKLQVWDVCLRRKSK